MTESKNKYIITTGTSNQNVVNKYANNVFWRQKNFL